MTEFEKWLVNQGYAKDQFDLKDIGRKSGLAAFMTKPSANPKAIGFNPAADYGPFDAHDTATLAGMAYAKRDVSRDPKNGGGYDRTPKSLHDFDPRVTVNNQEGDSANSLEAERNHSIGWLKGSEQHRAKLEQSINDYDKEIAKLQAEISMSEAGDPMYNLAIMRLIMDDDNSLLMDIRGRIGKRIDQEFQEKMKKVDQDFTAEENEKNRQNTLEVAEMNKAEQKAAQQKDLDNAFASAQQLYEFALEEFEANPDDPKLKREVKRAKELYRQASVKANRLDDFNRFTANDNDNVSKKPLWDEAAAAYGVTNGQSGIKDWIDRNVKDPKLRATVLRDLEKSFYITEGDLGYSGAEAKINQDKANKADALNAKVQAVIDKTYKDKAERDKAYDALSKDVKERVIKGYKDGKYIIKKKQG